MLAPLGDQRHRRMPAAPLPPAAGHIEHIIQWVKTQHPFWNRTQGRDHFFWVGNDWGVCK